MKISVSRVLTSTGWASNQTLKILDGKIQEIVPASSKDKVENGLLIPGFIDTQVNGGGGVLLNQTPTIEGVETLAKAHLKYGTTGMLPTLITDQADVMARAADAIAEAIDLQMPTILGVHFEGPFLSVTKKGVHEAGFIRTPSDRELATLVRQDIGKVLVTVAPETAPLEFIRELVAEGIVVALGHSNASAEQVVNALDAGASGFTHLFNAMSPLTSREPGMVGQALLNQSAFCGLIVDHHHVHPDSAKIAIRMKGAERTMLVTDAMAHVGIDSTQLPFFSTQIIRQGDKLTTPEGTLAGSCLDMLGAVVNTHRDLGVDLAQAIAMASRTPATFLGLAKQTGSIEVNQRANLLLLEDDLSIKQIWLEGVSQSQPSGS